VSHSASVGTGARRVLPDRELEWFGFATRNVEEVRRLVERSSLAGLAGRNGWWPRQPSLVGGAYHGGLGLATRFPLPVVRKARPPDVMPRRRVPLGRATASALGQMSTIYWVIYARTGLSLAPSESR
jgi:hypothetical protein